jgi:hypothetical protein
MELVKFHNPETGAPYQTSSSANATSSSNPPEATGKNFHEQVVQPQAPQTVPASNPVGANAYLFSYLSPPDKQNAPTFSSPASFLTTATSPSAVLAVSGISATNLLITSSGALGFSQIANLNAAVINSSLNNPNNTTTPLINTNPLISVPSTGMLTSNNNDPLNSLLNTDLTAGLHGINNSAASYLPAKSTDVYKTNIKALDFCYSDENQKFTYIDAINLCVTVIAYASHTPRANQMLTILDVIIPRYVAHIKQETDTLTSSSKGTVGGFSSILDKQANMHFHMDIVHQARSEFAAIQKIAVSIKTLVSVSEFLTRTYTGPRTDNLANLAAKAPNLPNVANALATTNPSMRTTSNRSPSIMAEEDSNRAAEERKKQAAAASSTAAGGDNGGAPEDNLIRQEFRTPRDTLLNIVSEFVFFASKRVKELYKTINDPSLKMTELIDTKGHSKLVEIAHTLLKLWDDSVTLAGNGIQKYNLNVLNQYSSEKFFHNFYLTSYFQKLLPVTDWSQDEIKPSFNNLLRRIDRLFTKISKKPNTKVRIKNNSQSSIVFASLTF